MGGMDERYRAYLEEEGGPIKIDGHGFYRILDCFRTAIPGRKAPVVIARVDSHAKNTGGNWYEDEHGHRFRSDGIEMLCRPSGERPDWWDTTIGLSLSISGNVRVGSYLRPARTPFDLPTNEWFEIASQEDADYLLEEAEEFHDWFVVGCRYNANFTLRDGFPFGDPDNDSLILKFCYDVTEKDDGRLYAFEMRFSGIRKFQMAPEIMFPIGGCALLVLGGNVILINEEDVPDKGSWPSPLELSSSPLVAAMSARWRPITQARAVKG